MTDPVSAVAIGSSVLGGLTSASGASAAGQAGQQQANYQASVALMNAQIAQQNAEYAVQQGEQQSQKYGMGAAQQFGKIVTAQASSGLDVNSGSNKQVQDSQRLVTGMDLDQIRSNAAKTAYNFDVQATQDVAQASMDYKSGANQAAAGNINAASSILGTAGSVASKWMQSSQVSGSGGSTLGSAANFLFGGGSVTGL